MKTPLPIDEFLPDILRKLKDHDCLVLTASPGAGKTTRLPPACLDIVKGRVLVLEPRRMAAVAAASRIAEENGWQPGREVGWQVRFDNRSQADTRLIFLTEALLARKMIDDPELVGVDLVILDEFHERSLHTDLSLGLLKELNELGRGLKIIVMSATLMASEISRYLNNAPIVEVPGRLFPLQIHHSQKSQALQTPPPFFDRVAEAAREAMTAISGDLLVFLPGVGEIERVRERLSSWCDDRKFDLLALHGSLPLEEQRQVLRAGARRRVILTTNIAESSVTVDGVDGVLDTGLAKVNRFDPRTGFSRLDLSRISLNSAIQRSGRSARQKPGQSWRLWTVHDEQAMPKDAIPEVQRADLGEALLFLSQQGVRDFDSFSWFEKPPVALLASARATLLSVGAIDSEGALTARGKKLLRYPLPPRAASLIVAAEDHGDSRAVKMAARLCALLQEKDFLSDNEARSHIGDGIESDPGVRLLEFDRRAPGPLKRAAEQIEQLARRPSRPGPTTRTAGAPSEGDLIRELLLQAFPDRLCRRRGATDRGLMVGGRGVRLDPKSVVKNSEFFIALDGVEGLSDRDTVVGSACGLEKDFLLKQLGSRVTVAKEIRVDGERVQIAEGRAFQGLWLEEPNLRNAPADVVAEHLPQILTDGFDALLKANEGLHDWFARWRFFQRHDEKAAAFEFDADRLLGILTEASYGDRGFKETAAKELTSYFERALPTELAKRFHIELPEKLEVPSGSRLPVRYPADGEAFLEVRLQELFGWREAPKILSGRRPLALHLLGPNYRPVQITSDLASFWKNAYPEVRSELRARYPKHSWPDDPLTAKPEAKGRRRF